MPISLSIYQEISKINNDIYYDSVEIMNSVLNCFHLLINYTIIIIPFGKHRLLFFIHVHIINFAATKN